MISGVTIRLVRATGQGKARRAKVRAADAQIKAVCVCSVRLRFKKLVLKDPQGGVTHSVVWFNVLILDDRHTRSAGLGMAPRAELLHRQCTESQRGWHSPLPPAPHPLSPLRPLAVVSDKDEAHGLCVQAADGEEARGKHGGRGARPPLPQPWVEQRGDKALWPRVWGGCQAAADVPLGLVDGKVEAPRRDLGSERLSLDDDLRWCEEEGARSGTAGCSKSNLSMHRCRNLSHSLALRNEAGVQKAGQIPPIHNLPHGVNPVLPSLQPFQNTTTPVPCPCRGPPESLARALQRH